MYEYIDRKPIIDKLKRTSTNATNTFINTVLIGLLNDEPTADVVPRIEYDRVAKELERVEALYFQLKQKEEQQ